MERLDVKIIKTILNNSADSVVVTDKEGVIQYVNPAFFKITGYSFDEALGQTPRILKSGSHDKAFYEDLWKVILTGEQCRIVFENKRKNGELYYHEEIITPILEGEDIMGFVSNGRDVTELVNKQKKLNEYCVFVDTVFETLSAQMGAFKLIKDIKHKIGE